LYQQESELNSELINSARSGDSVAFEQLITGQRRQLLSLAAGLARDLDEAEDIYQEAMISAFNALPKFRGDSQFSTWLYRIVVNSANSYRRKFRNSVGRLFTNREVDDSQIEFGSSSGSELEAEFHTDNPENALHQSQLGRAIAGAVALLSRQEKVAFVLCHQQELKITQAAVIMECSEGTVKQTLFRAREKMRKQLSGFSR